MKKAGLTEVSLHDLRHSHASILLSKGVPVPAVSEQLGHANPNVTMAIYAHAIPADSRSAAKIWNDAVSREVPDSRMTPGMSADVSTGTKKDG